MSFKSILLHLANDPGRQSRTEVALDFARRHGAIVRALFVEPTGRMPDTIAGRGFSYAFISESRAAARETAARLSTEFAATCSSNGITGEWIDEPGEPIDLIARFAMLADLVVVGRHDAPGLESTISEELPGRIPCPALVLPKAWSGAPVGRRVLVAWKNGLPSARILRGALPVLRRAEAVTVLTIGADACEGNEVVAYLARHGVSATARCDSEGDDNAGEVILSVADEIAADLIVMGSYSRSRLREMVFGGATHHVVTHMRVPILFGH
jgi:nucleotide-binding universal stress UspA family protein